MKQFQHLCRLIPVALVVAAVIGGPEAAAQELRGIVIETGTSRPLTGIDVSVLNADREPIASTVTDRDGRFAIRPPAGDYFVYAEGLSHTPVLAGPVTLVERDFVEVELRLEARAITLGDSLFVSVEGNAKLERMGFYHRRRRGIGVFLSDEDIAKKTSAVTVAHLLTAIPGVNVDNRGVVTLTGMISGTGYCPYSVYLDGAMRVSRVQPDVRWPMRLIRPQDVAGIEIYRRISEVPIQYSRNDGGCGVILIWSQGR